MDMEKSDGVTVKVIVIRWLDSASKKIRIGQT